MSDTMRAVVVRGGRFALEEVPRPHAGPGELVLRIESAGICAADRKIYAGGHPWQLPDPYFPGHEYVGRIVEMGEGSAKVTGLSLGERAIAEILVPCRRCWYCHRGAYTHCDNARVCVGAWAEYLRIPAGALLHRVPPDLTPIQGALIEPLACSIHAVNLAQIDFPDAVVVSGLGAIGMGILQVARLKNPRLLMGADVNENLLLLANENGADRTFNPLREDLGARVVELTEGRGADIYIEASGSPASLCVGVQILRKGGRLVVFGVYGGDVTLDFNQVSEFKELELIGGHMSPNTYPEAISYLAGSRINWTMMATHTFPLEEFEKAINVRNRPDVTSIKTILIPWEA